MVSFVFVIFADMYPTSSVFMSWLGSFKFDDEMKPGE